jgi:hypothetical protein
MINLYLPILYKFVLEVHHWANYHATINELCLNPHSSHGIEEDSHQKVLANILKHCIYILVYTSSRKFGNSNYLSLTKDSTSSQLI